jgi:hypothetical protein
MQTVQKDDFIGFRVPAALKRALVAAAEAEHRSLGQLCTLALMEFLERRGDGPTNVRTRATGVRSARSTRAKSRAKARR